jgi:hypothetical protein
LSEGLAKNTGYKNEQVFPVFPDVSIQAFKRIVALTVSGEPAS